MHRSAAEGRFGVAEPAGRASVCARTATLGVSSNLRGGMYGFGSLGEKWGTSNHGESILSYRKFDILPSWTA